VSDDRKVDDGSAGPRPQGEKHGVHPIEDSVKRAAFLLRDKGVKAKVVSAPKHEKPEGETSAKTKDEA
jgi:hypothetical protein